MFQKWNADIAKIFLSGVMFIFLMGCVYFSYFFTKEILTQVIVSPTEHAQKFARWKYFECDNPYSYMHDQMVQTISDGEKNFSEEVKLDTTLSPEEKESKIQQENEKRITKCKNELITQSSIIQKVDYKFWMIKYGLATLFFVILLAGSFMYRAKYFSKK